MIDQRGRVGLWVVGFDEIVGTGQNIVDASPSRVNHQRSGYSIARSHAPEHEGFLDVLGVAPPGTDARSRLLCGVIQNPTHLLGTEAGCTAGRCSRAHGPDQIVGFFHAGTDGLHAPHADVIPKCHGSHEMRATDAELLAHSQSCRNHGAAWMGASGCVIVVAFVGMRQLPICKCRLDRSTDNLGSNHSRNPLASVVPSELDCLASGQQV